ncbi:ABC transporter substrate-binding protein [Alkaliphilus sp. B6464]|uniref:ABC transporter substrate-binding protein n=1 Tax=Alkaliphilus sp. B6464 TaxID=2731219 RepID=UPI001BA4F84A|nr:ABC transporter substrate-binding protein [Alkaliphilus sp. B6464]QUH19975.1 ABC transporter substrate-binding protein [Alkaliphilus sp. B6464]
MKKRMIFVSLFIICIAILILYYSTYIQINAEEKECEVYKIGVLTVTDERLVKVEGMYEGLKQYGFSEDNVDIIIKNASGDVEILDELAQEIMDIGVDAIVTTGTSETAAAKKATMNKEINKEIPVAFIGVGCTVELGFVEGNISTACNITGVDSHYVQLSGKRLEFLKRLVPDTEEVLVLYNPETTPFGPSSEFLYDAAEKLSIQLDIVPVTSQKEVVEVLNEKSDYVDGVMLMCSLLFESMIDSIVEITLENQVPVMGITDRQVEKGILAFYGSTSQNEGIQAARIVANMLKGQDPRIIPIESPEKLELYINVDTARQLGVDIETTKMPFVDHFVHNSER